MGLGRRYGTILLVLVVFTVVSAIMVERRSIDGDEGYYATAARLVMEGKTPYLDFFYPQMPYLPYIYGPAYAVVGNSLAGLRRFSIVLGLISLVLWWALLKDRFEGGRWVLAVGLLIVALNPYFLSWNLTVKTYAAANLCVFGFLWAVSRGSDTPGPRAWAWMLAAGLFAGLAVGVRLLYLPWAGIMFLVLLVPGWTGRTGRVWTSALAYGAGAALLLAPAAMLYLQDADRFMFNNLGYHRLRWSPLTAPGSEGGSQSLAAAQALISAIFTNPFMVFQLILAGLGLWWMRRNPDSRLRPILRVSGIGAAVLTVTCLFPDPVYEQYFTGAWTPLLAPLVFAGLMRVNEMAKERAWGLALAMCLGLALTSVDLFVLKTGMDWKAVWTFEHLETMADEIEEWSEPGDEILSFWPGYVFQAGRKCAPGMENHFAIGVTEKLTRFQRRLYRIPEKDDLYAKTASQGYPIIITGTWMNEAETTLPQKFLKDWVTQMKINYKIAAAHNRASVLVPYIPEDPGQR